MDNGLILYKFPTELPICKTYNISVDDDTLPVFTTQIGSYVNFGMSKSLELTIELKKQPREVTIRPISKNIHATITGKFCKIQLDKPCNLSIEIDGNINHPLFVFANPPLPDAPSPDDPLVHYFEAGKVHEVGEIILQSNETIYLEGGAVVRGTVRAKGAKNVAICGAGVFDSSTRMHKTNMLVFRECEIASIENIILLDTFGWSIHLSGTQKARLNNVRVLGWRANCDGLDIEYSHNVHVTDCFWRTSDDCVALKALYPPNVPNIPFEEMIDPETLGRHKVPRITGDAIGDITIERSVFWNDWPGNAMEIGFELRADILRNVTVRDCDIIHVIRGAAISIHNADRVRIENIVLDDIRVEDTDELIDFYIGCSIYSDDCPERFRRSNPNRTTPPKVNCDYNSHDNSAQWYIPNENERSEFSTNRGQIRRVTVRNLNCLSNPRNRSLICGFDAEHGISDITFENLQIANETITNASEDRFRLEYVNNLHFRNLETPTS